MATRQTDEQPLTFFDRDGSKLFALPKKHFPANNEQQTDFLIRSRLGNTLIFSDSVEIIPIDQKYGKQWYFINRTGQIIKKLPKENISLFPMHEGVTVASRKSPELTKGGYAPFIYAFLNQEGENILDTVLFSKATSFSEGVAVVKYRDLEEPWRIIDKDGKEIGRFSKDIQKNITRVHAVKDGLIKVQVKQKVGYAKNRYLYFTDFYNIKGQRVIHTPDFFSNASDLSISEFADGVAYAFKRRGNKKVVYFDTAGQIILQLDQIHSCTPVKSGYFLITTKTSEGTLRYNLYNTKGKLISLSTKENETIQQMNLFHGYVRTSVINQTSKERQFIVYDLATLNEAARLTDYPNFITKDRLFFATDDFKQTLKRITDFDGNIIYEPPIEAVVFKSMTEALKAPQKVRRLEIFLKEKDLKELTKLRNVEYLSLQYSDVDDLQEIASLNNLRSLELNGLDKLRELPAAITKIKTLEELSISSCRNLKGVEKIIQAMPQLKLVSTVNFSLANGFAKRMQQERPYLEFSEVEFIDAGIQMEEEEVEVAPPPKKKN